MYAPSLNHHHNEELWTGNTKLDHISDPKFPSAAAAQLHWSKETYTGYAFTWLQNWNKH